MSDDDGAWDLLLRSDSEPCQLDRQADCAAADAALLEARRQAKDEGSEELFQEAGAASVWPDTKRLDDWISGPAPAFKDPFSCDVGARDEDGSSDGTFEDDTNPYLANPHHFEEPVWASSPPPALGMAEGTHSSLISAPPVEQPSVQRAARARRKTSEFTGVSWARSDRSAQIGKWHAQIGVRGGKINLGYFDIEEDAARVYDAALVAYKSKPTVNFPGEAPRAEVLAALPPMPAPRVRAPRALQLRQAVPVERTVSVSRRNQLVPQLDDPVASLHDKYEELLRVHGNDAALLLWNERLRELAFYDDRWSRRKDEVDALDRKVKDLAAREREREREELALRERAILVALEQERAARDLAARKAAVAKERALKRDREREEQRRQHAAVAAPWPSLPPASWGVPTVVHYPVQLPPGAPVPPPFFLAPPAAPGSFPPPRGVPAPQSPTVAAMEEAGVPRHVIYANRGPPPGDRRYR